MDNVVFNIPDAKHRPLRPRRPEWGVVRAARYPTLNAGRPANWEKIAEGCARIGKVGPFRIGLNRQHDDAFDPIGTVPPTPLWRGHRMLVRFEGLVSGPD
jgi:hypothetical protein